MKPYKIHVISRKNPHTGFIETINYTGPIRNKPKGWKVIRSYWHTPTLINGFPI